MGSMLVGAAALIFIGKTIQWGLEALGLKGPPRVPDPTPDGELTPSYGADPEWPHKRKVPQGNPNDPRKVEDRVRKLNAQWAEERHNG